MIRRAPSVISCAAGLLILCAAHVDAQHPAAAARPVTRAERTDYRETSRSDEVMAFVREVVAAAPQTMRLTTFGYTLEGKPLPLVVVGHVSAATAQAVKQSGKTRIYLQGNIHAGEVEGKEALLMLLRELSRGEHAAWLQSSVLLIAPIYNADGNDHIRITERNAQNGPIGGVGTRENAQGLDLNRDHMKLESPEARSFAALFRDYDPQLAVDLHTTNGTYHAYQLTYSPPLHPNTAAPIVDWLRKDWLPTITQKIKAKDGWDFYYYGNLEGGEPRPGRTGGRAGAGAGAGAAGAAAAGAGAGAASGTPPEPPRERGWYTFDHRPRFNNNYIGLRNRLAILSEAYSYLPFRDRIAVTRRFVIEILEFAHAHAAEIRQRVADLDKQSLVGETLALRATLQRAPEMVDILLGEVQHVHHPYTGATMLQRLDVKHVEHLPEYGTFVASESEKVPPAYLIPATLDHVVDLLDAHGIHFATLARETSIEVEEFEIASTEVAPRAFQNHRERSVTGTYHRITRAIAAGTIVVPMNQPLARLAFTLLEPRSDDGVVNWNVLDDVLEKEKTYPIRRAAAPIADTLLAPPAIDRRTNASDRPRD
jgi:hypothetical protein